MSIAIAVKYMIEAGLPAEAIAAAIAEMEAALIPARSKGAARQARYRLRLEQREDRNERDDKRNKTSQSVTCDEKRNTAPLSPSPLSSPQTPQQTPHPHTPEYITPARVKADPFPRPEWAEPSVWADFLKNRRAKRKPNTASCHTALIRDVELEAQRSGKSSADVLKFCTEQGWAGIYEIMENVDGISPSNPYRATRNIGRNNGNSRPKEGFSAAVRTVAGGSASAAAANER